MTEGMRSLEQRDLLTIKEACAYLRIHRETLRKLHVPCQYVGTKKLYRRADLDKALKRRPSKLGGAAA